MKIKLSEIKIDGVGTSRGQEDPWPETAKEESVGVPLGLKITRKTTVSVILFEGWIFGKRVVTAAVSGTAEKKDEQCECCRQCCRG